MYGAVDVAGYDEYLTTNAAVQGATELGPDPAKAQDVAFDLCVARVEKHAGRHLPPKERLIWIHDCLGKEAKYQFQRGLRWMAWLRSMGRDVETREYIGENLPSLRVIPPVYFGDPEGSLELQLADVCCSTIRLKLIERFYPKWLLQQNWGPLVAPFHAILERRGSLGHDDWPPECIPGKTPLTEGL